MLFVLKMNRSLHGFIRNFLIIRTMRENLLKSFVQNGMAFCYTELNPFGITFNN